MELTTFLWFDGCAREAADFYTSIFPNSSRSDAAEGPEVLVNFSIFGRPFIALNGGPQFPYSEAISFQIPCANPSENNK